MIASLITQPIIEILQRDLRKTIAELNQYPDEGLIWLKEGSINNTAGNLALHIGGAVHHFIGAVLGKNGYKRERDNEFSLQNFPRSEILKILNDAIAIVPDVLSNLSDEDVSGDFPEKTGGSTLSTNFFLIHLTGHINYHLGQINYHRRILSK